MTPRENSVKQLSELYNVVTGVALSLAITKVIDPSSTGIPIKLDLLFNFLSFLIIIIPFHQGAVRHLYATYVGWWQHSNQGGCACDRFPASVFSSLHFRSAKFLNFEFRAIYQCIDAFAHR